MSRVHIASRYYNTLEFSGPDLFGCQLKLSSTRVRCTTYTQTDAEHIPLLHQRVIIINGLLPEHMTVAVDKLADFRHHFYHRDQEYVVPTGYLTIIPMHLDGERWVSSNSFGEGLTTTTPPWYKVTYEDLPLDDSAKKYHDSFCLVMGEITTLDEKLFPPEWEERKPPEQDDDTRPR